MTATKPVTLRRLRSILKTRFGGLIKAGKHTEDGECCVLELVSVAKGLPWTDDPQAVRSFDLRPLNDIPVSDELRAEWMPRLIVAYDGSLDWPDERRKEVAGKIVIGVVQKIIAELPSLPDAVREQCRKASTLSGAYAYAARAAAYAAYAAAVAARAACEERFVVACQIWLDAAGATP